MPHSAPPLRWSPWSTLVVLKEHHLAPGWPHADIHVQGYTQLPGALHGSPQQPSCLLLVLLPGLDHQLVVDLQVYETWPCRYATFFVTFWRELGARGSDLAEDRTIPMGQTKGLLDMLAIFVTKDLPSFKYRVC